VAFRLSFHGGGCGVTDSTLAPATLAAFRFKPGQSGNPSGLPKNFRRPTDALRQLVGFRGDSVKEVVTRFKTARGREMRGADHLAVTAFTKACDPESRNGDAMFREILDRLDGPIVRNLKVESEEKITINVVPYEAMLQGKRAPELPGAELRRKALQAAVLEAEIVEDETSGSPAGDASPDEGERF
jgi:hypothetical protein